jgi:CheY-like chemotaxis protein
MSDTRTDSPSGTAAKILVVEDNDFVRMQIVRYLSDAGFSTIEAQDGQVALGLVADAQLAIVDVRMEPIDGFEFIKSIRGKNMSTPVILVTGDQNPDLLNEANKWGVTAVLMKPVQKDRLIKMAARAIQHAAQRAGA